MPKTLIDLSKEIGLSTATISRVLNGETCVSPETRERVLNAVTESGYRPRQRRKSVTSANAGTVLLIAGALTNPITLGFIDGIRSRLADAGYKTLLSISDYRSDSECTMLEYASKNGFSGIFMLNALECPRLISLLRNRTVPVILVNRYLKALDTDVAMVDNYRSGYLATQYLLGKGHRRILHIAGPATSITCQNRTAGFVDAMQASSVPVSEKCIYYGDRTYQSGFECGKQIARMPSGARPTAVFATTGLMATGLACALRSEGLRIPEDISIICNDDPSREYLPSSEEFTCYRQDPLAIGRTAAEMFLERVSDPSAQPKRVVFPPVLSEHGSVRTEAN